jgi:hypothetical protein
LFVLLLEAVAFGAAVFRFAAGFDAGFPGGADAAVAAGAGCVNGSAAVG